MRQVSANSGYNAECSETQRTYYTIRIYCILRLLSPWYTRQQFLGKRPFVVTTESLKWNLPQSCNMCFPICFRKLQATSLETQCTLMSDVKLCQVFAWGTWTGSVTMSRFSQIRKNFPLSVDVCTGYSELNVCCSSIQFHRFPQHGEH